MKKKLVVIGANDFQNKLILKAKALGYETHAFAWASGDSGEKNADFFYPISITDKEEILEVCKKIKPVAILSIASDLAMITVSYVATRLGLNCNDEDCVKVTTNKYEMRKKLSEGGVYCPLFTKVSESDYKEKLKAIKESFFDNENSTVIVKPTDRSGSRGITKLNHESGLEKALLYAFSQSFEKSAIIEEYIEGDEFSCECISFEGKHNFLATTRKFTSGAPHFIETGHIEPSGLDESTTQEVKRTVFSALNALSVKNGASHTEFKIGKDGKVKIIELGARMGGDCIGSDLVMLSSGYDFLEMVIDVACSKAPKIERVAPQRTAEIRFIFSDEDIEVLEKIKRESPEKIHFISEIEDTHSREVVDSSTRFGYYILAY